MRIGIIGTRGIPNQYGGFEQFAEYVAPELVARGHEVYVYNSSLHPHKDPTWKGVHLIVKSDPENLVGSFGQFIYDLNCIRDARKRNFDVILQLGYTSSSLWSSFFPKGATLVTNMDGLEWKRTKYSTSVRRFLKRAESWAVRNSDHLIADSIGIQKYLYKKFKRKSTFIPYGAHLFHLPDDSQLAPYKLQQDGFNMLIARMEPENNIETILQGHHNSARKRKLILIGNYQNAFGTLMKKKYEDKTTEFWGSVYDINLLNNLRHYSHLYFHGHSVGGTNPSLLEAMASQALVAAHNNIFNRSVLEKDAFYFETPEDVSAILNNSFRKNEYNSFIQNNNKKIVELYSWLHIADQLESCLLKALDEKKAI